MKLISQQSWPRIPRALNCPRFIGWFKVTFDECHRTIRKGDVGSLRNALDAGKISPNLSNRLSWTLLMLAALQGNVTVGELLVERGAAVDAVNDFGETALTLAAHKGHEPFMRMLLSRGTSADAHPHGHSLEEWLKAASGLADEKLASILQIVNAAKQQSQSGG